VKVFTPNNR